MYQINITTDDAKNIVEFIELWFIPSIRQDEEIDNINYLKSILKVYDEMKKISRSVPSSERNQIDD